MAHTTPRGGPQGPPARPGQSQQGPNTGGSKSISNQLSFAIDFGTTFSSVAYAFVSSGNNIRQGVITDWPGARVDSRSRIPTVIYYDEHQKVIGWGADCIDALTGMGSLKSGVQKVECFKLHLMGYGNSHSDLDLPPLPPGKSDIDVIADYLFHLHHAIRDALHNTLGEVFDREERNIKYYLTVPAIWTYAGTAAIRQTCFQAGIIRDAQDSNLTIISELEAAVTELSNMGLLLQKVKDIILIIDLGGGTVDLSAYQIDEEAPFAISEYSIRSSGSCGSKAINRDFSDYLRTKIRNMKIPSGSKTASKIYARCMADFDSRIKMDFRHDGQRWAVDVGLETDDPDAGIENGCITFSDDEILQCFKPVLDSILDLIRAQIAQITATHHYTLSNILLVGDFISSEFLFKQIKLHFAQYKSKIARPVGFDCVVVRGAVTASINTQLITHRIPPCHYIVALPQPFKEGHDPEAYRLQSPGNPDLCKYSSMVIVTKGQRMNCGEPVKVSISRYLAPGSSLIFEDILYSCDEDICPKYINDARIKQVVTLTSDLSRKKLEDFERVKDVQDTLYNVIFNIFLTFDCSEFNAEVVCQGESMGRCQTKFS